jgi:hypothetical protein
VVQTIIHLLDSLRTVIINGPAYKSLYGANCEDDGVSHLAKVHSFLKSTNASSPSPSTSHYIETTDSVPDIACIGKEAQHACDMKMFSVVSLPSTYLITLDNKV